MSLYINQSKEVMSQRELQNSLGMSFPATKPPSGWSIYLPPEPAVVYEPTLSPTKASVIVGTSNNIEVVGQPGDKYDISVNDGLISVEINSEGYAIVTLVFSEPGTYVITDPYDNIAVITAY